MHSVILGSAGYTLLVSSLVFLFYVFRNKVKRFTISSLHTFAISDILSSLITGVLLIFNQYLTISSPIEPENNNYSTINRTAVKFFGQTKSSTYFVAHLDGLSEENVTSNACHFRDVVAHYAMFTFPFVNAFVSLLSFSARTCIDLDRVVGECGKLGKTTRVESGRAKFTRYKADKLMTGLGLAGQWIVPILLTAVFNFAGDENVANFEDSRDMGCVYGMNFPFDHCYTTGNNVENYFNKSAYTRPSFNDYIATIDSPHLLANDSSGMEDEFSEIVSKIYDIVETVVNLNESERTESTSFYEIAHLANITKYMNRNEEKIVHNEENLRNRTEILGDGIFDVWEEINNKEKTAENETSEHHQEVPHDEILESASPSEFDSDRQQTASVIENEKFHAGEELKLFESLLKNSSQTVNEEETPETDKVHLEEFFYPFHNETSTPRSVETEVQKDPGNSGDDKPVIGELSTQSDSEIYADIVKKIQAVTTQLRGRKDIKYLRKKNQRGRSQEFSTANENFQEIPVCMKNQCFVSTRFLKIHLLVLIFLVYFVPIFTSAILQTRAKYACQHIKEKLALEEAKKKNDSEFLGISRSKNEQSIASTSSWFPPANFENELSSTSFEDLVVQKNLERNTDTVEEEKINRDSSIDIFNQCAKGNDKTLENMKKEVSGIEKLLELFQTCFLVAVFSWTPIFFELLTKVFLCMSTVEWLFDASFLGALLFGIARNILNLRMIKIHDIIHNDCIKDNSVFPSSST